MGDPHPNDPYGQQTKSEFDWWLGFVRDAKSILEIGSAYGHTLRMMSDASPRARIRSIDLGGGGKFPDFKPYLLAVEEELKQNNRDVQILIADSKWDLAINWGRRWAPYDAVFIDGDHSDDGVMADWLNYGPLGRVVGFHDVGGVVKRFWKKIKEDTSLKTVEKIAAHGIGVVIRG